MSAGRPAPSFNGSEFKKLLGRYVDPPSVGLVRDLIEAEWQTYSQIVATRASWPTRKVQREAADRLCKAIGVVRDGLKVLPPQIEAAMHSRDDGIEQVVRRLRSDALAISRALAAAIERVPEKNQAGRPSRVYEDQFTDCLRAIAKTRVKHGKRTEFTESVLTFVGITPKK